MPHFKPTTIYWKPHSHTCGTKVMCVHCIGGTNINTCLCVPRLVCIFILPCVSVCSSENEWVHVCVYVCVCMCERVHVCVPQKATEEDVEELA